MTTYAQIETLAQDKALSIMGAFRPDASDKAPAGCQTLVLLGPAEPGFWARFTASPEYSDGAPDPMDRWSRRTVGSLATALGGQAVFPFGGVPYHPFIAWAQRSARAWISPVGLLVHDSAGLFISYRGALALASRIDFPAPPQRAPCDSCVQQPCRGACPVDALRADTYALANCHDYLDTPAGAACMNAGCAARRACPVSQSYGRLAEHSAFHMAAFHQ